MGISYIHKICKELGITKYSINQDLSIDVFEDVKIIIKIEKFPINFNHIEGSFKCSHNLLKTLEGGPSVVKGDFNCSYNFLTTLKGSPKEVTGAFDCYSNNLIDLKGGPKLVNSFYSDKLNIEDILYDGCEIVNYMEYVLSESRKDKIKKIKKK